MDDVYPAAIDALTRDVGSDGTTAYWLDRGDRDEGWQALQADFAAPNLRDGQRLLKQARQRFIFQDRLACGSVVVKLFPLASISSKLRHQKYAYREFANMRRAEGLSIRLPRPIAFLEKRRMGLVVCSGVIQENLEGSEDLLSLHRNGLEYERVADHAAGVLKGLYEAGVNHIDTRDENIMLDAQTQECRVIDWQYASFVEAKADWLLEYLAGYFIALAPDDQRDGLLRGWASDLHLRCSHPLEQSQFLARVEALGKARIPVGRRLKLAPMVGL